MHSFDYYQRLNEDIRDPRYPRATQVSLLLPVGLIFLFVYPAVNSFWISAPVSVLLGIALVAILAAAKVAGRKRARGHGGGSKNSLAINAHQARVESAVERAEDAARSLASQIEDMQDAVRMTFESSALSAPIDLRMQDYTELWRLYNASKDEVDRTKERQIRDLARSILEGDNFGRTQKRGD